MVKYYKYFKYLFRHKWYVGVALVKEGCFLRAIFHDWSKFLPSEFIPYANFFYGEGEKGQSAFNLAWLKHIKRNSHHWQHHVLIEDSGKIIPLEMPHSDVVEMYCDWVGAGMAIHGKNDVEDFYNNNKDKMILHKNTRILIETFIEFNKK